LNLFTTASLVLALLLAMPSPGLASDEPGTATQSANEEPVDFLPATSAYALPSTGTITAADIGDGVWVVPELDETSITLMLDNLQEWGIKNVYVDVFRSGETLFPSQLFPQKPGAAGRDWLTFIVQESHARDIRAHAWLQTLCWAEPGPLLYATTSVVQMHPEWVDLSQEGQPFDGKSLARFVNPAVPEVSSRLTSLTLEICAYPIDGINLDAIQYNHRADMGYHEIPVREFEEETSLDARELERDMGKDSDWMRWTLFREDKLTSLVEALSGVARAETERQGRRIMLSTVVYPGYEQNRGANFRFQHWSHWVREGLVDATTPGCFDGDLPGLERQLWEARSIHMGSDVACLPGFMLDPMRRSTPSTAPSDDVPENAHPSLADQKRLLRNAGFQYCNIMDYEALLNEKTQPSRQKPTRRNNGLWGLFRGNDDVGEP
jgi:hypothetical protein